MRLDFKTLKSDLFFAHFANTVRTVTNFIECKFDFVQLFHLLRTNRLFYHTIGTNGGMIGFISDKGRILVEINAGLAQEAGLKISSKLLEVARRASAPSP